MVCSTVYYLQISCSLPKFCQKSCDESLFPIMTPFCLIKYFRPLVMYKYLHSIKCLQCAMDWSIPICCSPSSGSLSSNCARHSWIILLWLRKTQRVPGETGRPIPSPHRRLNGYVYYLQIGLLLWPLMDTIGDPAISNYWLSTTDCAQNNFTQNSNCNQVLITDYLLWQTIWSLLIFVTFIT